MAPASRLCLICGDVLGSDIERREHMDREHAGARVAWRDKRPWIIAADGSETRIGAAAIKRMRANAREAGGTTTRSVRTAKHPRDARTGHYLRTTPEPEPPPMVERPLADPDAPPYFEQVTPPHFAATGEPAETPTPDPGAVSRETVRLALDQPTLAEMIRNLSIVISDWDGAGEQGHLSRIEAGQIAMILHEPAVDAVMRYFGGNVNRFRLALAAGIILLGKGRVHLRAIQRSREAAVVVDEGEAVDRSWLATQPVEPVEVPVFGYVDTDRGPVPVSSNGHAPEPEPLDPIAQLAARQRAWATTPREDS